MSRKKQKKQARKRRSPNSTYPAAFGVGHKVRVKKGIFDPEYEDIPLGGWAGIIVAVNRQSNPPTYEIEWNQQTLDRMHPVYRTRCDRDDLRFEVIWLSETDLEPDTGEPVEIEQPTRITTRPLSEFNQGDRIRAIFGLNSNDPLPPLNRQNLRRYGDYLSTRLSFPFRAVYIVEAGRSTLQLAPLNVLSLLDADEWNREEGILCEVEQDGEHFEFALSTLAIASNRQPRQLIEDYTFWFENCEAESFDTSIDPPQSSTYIVVTDSELHPTAPESPDDNSAYQSVPRSTPKIMALLGLYGAVYGFAMGPLLGVVEYAWIGAAVGAVLLGLIGLSMRANSETEVRAPIILPFNSTMVVMFRTAFFSLLGAMLGTIIVAFLGTLIGAFGGVVVSWLLRKQKICDIAHISGAFCGGGIGAVGLAFYRDKDSALLWGLHGAWIGGLSVLFVVVFLYGFIRFVARFQLRKAAIENAGWNDAPGC